MQKDPLNILPKMVRDKDGKLADSFISLDKTTNEYVALKRDSITPPESINDIFLSEKQKKDFVNGKPIQIGKDSYQMDINSENRVSGKNLQNVKFKSGEYSGYNFLLDAALVFSGLGVVVLVEHLAKMAFNNRESVHDLMKQDLRPAIKRTVAQITEKAGNGKNMSPNEKNELLVINVKDTIASQQKQKLKKQIATGSSAKREVVEFQQPAFAYTGTLLEHGVAPYEFNKDNKQNYFVRLKTDTGEQTVWGVDFSRAVVDSKAKIGDQIGIDHEGISKVKVNVDRKDAKGAIVGSEEKMIDRNNWRVQVLGAENKIGLAQSNSPIAEKNIPEIKNPKNVMHISFDATKDLEGQKSDINKQIENQLKNYDGKGKIVVNRETTAYMFTLPEEKQAKTEQSGKIEQLRSHINQEIHRKTKATFISANDEIKIVHPEQRQAGETKTVLKNDSNNQQQKAATAKNEIKKDVKEIQTINRRRGR